MAVGLLCNHRQRAYSTLQLLIVVETCPDVPGSVSALRPSLDL